jgi:hypothetical protein
MWRQECHQNVRVVQIQIKQRIPKSQVHWMSIITRCKLTGNTLYIYGSKEHVNNYWQYQDGNNEENSNTANFHLFNAVLQECYGSIRREFMRTEVLTAVNIQNMVFQIVTACRIYKFSSSTHLPSCYASLCFNLRLWPSNTVLCRPTLISRVFFTFFSISLLFIYSISIPLLGNGVVNMFHYPSFLVVMSQYLFCYFFSFIHLPASLFLNFFSLTSTTVKYLYNYSLIDNFLFLPE